MNYESPLDPPLEPVTDIPFSKIDYLRSIGMLWTADIIADRDTDGRWDCRTDSTTAPSEPEPQISSEYTDT